MRRVVPETEIDHPSLSLLIETDDFKPLHPELVSDKDLPDWQARRPFIISGYRVRYDPWQCLASCFQLHNESINIWTHALGGLLWLRESWLFAGHVAPADFPVVIAATLLGFAMFVASSVAHTFACVSPAADRVLWRCDYAGIVMLWFGRPVFDSYLLFGICEASAHSSNYTSACCR